MLENKYKQITISEHISLYDKIIPKDNFLRKLKENIDFSFVNKLVEKEYSEKYGRPAKDPEMMYKLLFLEIKYSLTDREVIERAKTDMAYKYFLDLNPEDCVPSYSLLSVFRNTKIKDESILEEMLQETVKQAIEKGIIKSNSIIVDATHTNSKNLKKTPTQVLREISKKLRKEIYRNEPELNEVFPVKPEETASAIENKNDGFEFIKDADTFRCPMGTIAVRKKLISGKKYKDGYRNDKMMYTFDKETCLNCPKKETCLGKNKENRAKRYTIKLLSIAHKEQYDFEQTEYFNKTLREERYKIEAKNAETKLAHGLCKARTVGLSGVRVQSYLTHIVTNLKRIIKLMDSKMAIE